MKKSLIAKENHGTATKMAEPLINSEPDIAQAAKALYGKRPSSPGDSGTPGKAEVPPAEDEESLAAQICFHWNKSLDGILEVGRLLNRAAEKLGKRHFKKTFVPKLPFSYTVAQRLRNLAKSRRINDPRYRPLMPFSWNTLTAIDNLSDAGFEYGIARGKITPKCQYKDIRDLRLKFPEPQAETASSATVEATKGSRMKRLHEIKAKMAKRQERLKNTPRPLVIKADNVMLEFHGPEVARLIDELNEQLPQKYTFISEVRLEEAK